jgi:hypothetical protein
MWWPIEYLFSETHYPTSSIVEVENMRARELRKLLLKLGANPEDLIKIIDRTDLKLLALKIISQQYSQSVNNYYIEQTIKTVLIMLIISIMFLIKEPVGLLLNRIFSSFFEIKYQVKNKTSMIIRCIKHRYILSSLSLILALFLDLLYPAIQISIAASWILPNDSPYHKYRIPMLSLPVNSRVLMKGMGMPTIKDTEINAMNDGSVSGSAKSAMQRFSQMGMNLGPMITIWIINWLKAKLEAYGASKLIHFVEEKEKRRDLRRKKKEEKKEKKKENNYHNNNNNTNNEINSNDIINNDGFDNSDSNDSPFQIPQATWRPRSLSIVSTDQKSRRSSIISIDDGDEDLISSLCNDNGTNSPKVKNGGFNDIDE